MWKVGQKTKREALKSFPKEKKQRGKSQSNKGDEMTVAQILEAAGISLDQQYTGSYPNEDGDTEPQSKDLFSRRIGIVAIVIIDYKNSPYNKDEIEYGKKT